MVLHILVYERSRGHYFHLTLLLLVVCSFVSALCYAQFRL